MSDTEQSSIRQAAGEIAAKVGNDLAYFTLIADLTTWRHRCRFALAPSGALAARYLDLPFAAVSFYGDTEVVQTALRSLLDPGEHAYALIGEVQRAQLETIVNVQNVELEWQAVYPNRMAFPGNAPALNAGDAVPLSRAVPLSAADWPAMVSLGERGGVYALETTALDKGPYFGVWRDGKLVSMAGTRLRLDWAGEIGNVVTDPDYRRQGLATMVVAVTTQALQAAGLQVILHVFQSNAGAVACYEHMGFVRLRTMHLVEFVL